MADLGRAALVVSLGLAIYAAVAGSYAAIYDRRRLADSARNALIACFGSTLIASNCDATYNGTDLGFKNYKCAADVVQREMATNPRWAGEPTPERSMSSATATWYQPRFSSPTRFSFGTRTLS